jgi:hypothetical protein
LVYQFRDQTFLVSARCGDLEAANLSEATAALSHNVSQMEVAMKRRSKQRKRSFPFLRGNVILSEAKDLSLDDASHKIIRVQIASIVRFLAPLGITG